MGILVGGLEPRNFKLNSVDLSEGSLGNSPIPKSGGAARHQTWIYNRDLFNDVLTPSIKSMGTYSSKFGIGFIDDS